LSDKPSRGTHSVTDAEADRVAAGEGAQTYHPVRGLLLNRDGTPGHRREGGGVGGIGAAYAPKYPANYKGLKQELQGKVQIIVTRVSL